MITNLNLESSLLVSLPNSIYVLFLTSTDININLYLEDITDKDYTHAQKVFEELKLKNLGDYDFYVQSNTLLLVDVIENFRNKCNEIYKLDSAHFLSAPG